VAVYDDAHLVRTVFPNTYGGLMSYMLLSGYRIYHLMHDYMVKALQLGLKIAMLESKT
jgi:hypothetical protein